MALDRTRANPNLSHFPSHPKMEQPSRTHPLVLHQVVNIVESDSDYADFEEAMSQRERELSARAKLHGILPAPRARPGPKSPSSITKKPSKPRNQGGTTNSGNSSKNAGKEDVDEIQVLRAWSRNYHATVKTSQLSKGSKARK